MIIVLPELGLVIDGVDVVAYPRSLNLQWVDRDSRVVDYDICWGKAKDIWDKSGEAMIAYSITCKYAPSNRKSGQYCLDIGYAIHSMSEGRLVLDQEPYGVNKNHPTVRSYELGKHTALDMFDSHLEDLQYIQSKYPSYSLLKISDRSGEI